MLKLVGLGLILGLVKIICPFCIMLPYPYHFLSLSNISFLGASISAFELLLGCGLSREFVYFGIALLSMLVVVEIVFIIAVVSCLNDINLAEVTLTKWRLNKGSIDKDLAILGLKSFNCCVDESNGIVTANRHVFDGPGRRLAIPNENSNLLSLHSSNPSNLLNSSNNSNSSTVNISTINGQKLQKTSNSVPPPNPFPKMPNSSGGSVV
jgi:hypothetical protein